VFRLLQHQVQDFRDNWRDTRAITAGIRGIGFSGKTRPPIFAEFKVFMLALVVMIAAMFINFMTMMTRCNRYVFTSLLYICFIYPPAAWE
jgi:hypothetical protein